MAPPERACFFARPNMREDTDTYPEPSREGQRSKSRLRIFSREVACEAAHFRAENEVGQRNQNSGQNQRLHAQWQGVGQAGKQDQQARHERPYDQPNQQKLEKDGFHKPTFAEDVARFRIEK